MRISLKQHTITCDVTQPGDAWRVLERAGVRFYVGPVRVPRPAYRAVARLIGAR